MMTDLNPLQTMCDQLAAVVAGVEGVRQATGTPPNTIGAFPYVEVFAPTGDFDASRPNGLITGIMLVNIDMHLSGNDAPRDAVTIHRLQWWIPYALYKTMKAGGFSAPIVGVGHIKSQLSVFPGGAGQGTDTVGIRFTVEVKTQGVIQ